MCGDLDIVPEYQHDDSRIYNASVSQLQAVISEIDTNCESVMLVGHNPGLADIVMLLCEQPIRLSPGNVVILQEESWQDFFNSKGQFIDKL